MIFTEQNILVDSPISPLIFDNKQIAYTQWTVVEFFPFMHWSSVGGKYHETKVGSSACINETDFH